MMDLSKAKGKIKSLANRFDGDKAVKVFISRKTGRAVGAILDGLGEETLRILIAENAYLSDQIPDTEKLRLKGIALPYLPIISELEPEEVYTWFLPQHRHFFSRTVNGEQWAINQLYNIKQYLCS